MSYNFGFNCLKCSLIALFLLIFQAGRGQSSALDALVDQHKKNYAGNIVIMAWKGDSVFYQKATGDYNINSQEEIGEASAWFTAALVMQFFDEGKISLDDPVAKYLPIFEKYAKSYLTIRHCLANTTGLEPDKGGIGRMVKKSRFETLEEEVESYAKREILNNPGVDYNYNQLGLAIAGRVLEIVGKKSFDRLMTEKIFRPLGMRKSSFSSEYSVNPFAGARSSAADYLRFMTMLQNKGVLSGKKILSEKAVAELLAVQAGDAKTVYSPVWAAQFLPTPGAWLVEKDRAGSPRVFASAAQNGIWAWADTCRNYSAIIFFKGPAKADSRPLFQAVKAALEQQIVSTCSEQD